MLALPLLCFLASSSAFAQESTQMPPWLDVVIVNVKPGYAADFEDRVKELMTARRKAGMPTGLVFSVERGRAGEYHIVTPTMALAANDNPQEPMPPDEMARWVSRIIPTTDGARFFYARTYPQHGIAGSEGAAAPKLLLLRTVRVVAGRAADYENWVAMQLMPAMRQAKVQGHTMSRGAFGDSPQNFYHAIPVSNWAAFDGQEPLLQALGESRYRELMDGTRGIVESASLTVAAIRPDLVGAE
jgi:hypothetical protein